MNIIKKINNKKSQILAWDNLGKYIIGAIIILVSLIIIGIVSGILRGNTNFAFDLFKW
ncbi:MAG: hypothetical protein PHT94_01970 [Candidatus Nanoarchaeia archaeon]|nr:hypothetical protein [Candidatus Nanoarchaeia archaeon]